MYPLHGSAPIRHSWRQGIARVVTGALGLVSSLLCVSAFAIPAPVGKITLTVGQATITSSGGGTRVAQRGATVDVGDRIETAVNGHVHLRFVDDALVSVRPASELLIEDYRYDAAAVERSRVKFQLLRGTARAISGAAAEGAREQFRLNTPLVAIGIRGTDFVVHSDDQLTTAAVSYGAIIMAPFGEGCKAQGSGPCVTAASRLLSADMSGMLAEYRSGLGQTELKPAVAYGAPISDLPRTASAGSAGSGRAGSSGTGGNASATANGSPVVIASASGGSDVTLSGDFPHNRPNTLVDNDSGKQNRLVLDAAALTDVKIGVPVTPPTEPVTPPVVVVPVPAQMVWGRWGADAVGPDDFSVVRGDARTGRAATVGNTAFVLYRNEGTFDFSRFSSQQGQTAFALDKGFAQFTDSGGQVSAAAVQGGTLGINFGARQFNTSLDLMSAATGAQTLSLQGAVDREGLFVASQNGQKAAGAIALDGKSVGYLFDKAAAGGMLSGITQWKAK
ncbi:MAG: hypothetical protein EOO24_00470 [Comamonadaceae bacterium]|nr:MAG: hypothetical protein EOO24_00470 [Comamonadaceae bacterium]